MADCKLTSNYSEPPRHSIKAHLILDTQQRKRFLSSLFGRYFIRGESLIYAWMRDLSDEYQGGYWNYYKLSNGGLYMSPEIASPYLRIRQNNFRGAMSTDALGIVCTLSTLRYLVYDPSVQIGCDLLTQNFFRLLHFVSDHREDRAIRIAIDC